MKYAALMLTLLVMASGLAKAEKPADQSKTLVYNEITEGSSALDRAAKNAYEFCLVADLRKRALE